MRCFSKDAGRRKTGLGRAGVALVALAATVGFMGCGSRSGDIPEGCVQGDQVPMAERDALLAASRQFYEQARGGAWKDIYDQAAAGLKEKQTESEFSGPLSRVLQEIGVPERRSTVATLVIRFGPGYPYRTEVQCAAAGEGLAPTLLLDENPPIQASLVETAEALGDRFYFSTLWHREGNAWRLAGFFVKPATLLGKTSGDYERTAGEERLAGNVRNAALLYNVAIDLAVPNAWTRPGEVEALERKQRRLSVSQLPVGQVEVWPAPPDSFRVSRVQYGVLRSGLALRVQYVPEGSLADTTALVPQADRLFRYVARTFPEYPRVFNRVALEAVDPGGRTWTRLYPLESRS
jgi:hypothetical protein